LNSIAHVNCAIDRCVTSVVGIESGPELAAENNLAASHILHKGPAFHGLIAVK
jgi:hypothetical protein